MINARTKYMAQLVADAFNVQEYEASVSTSLTVTESAFLPRPLYLVSGEEGFGALIWTSK